MPKMYCIYDNQVSGSYRDLEEMLLELEDMYVSLDKKTPFSLKFWGAIFVF